MVLSGKPATRDVSVGAAAFDVGAVCIGFGACDFSKAIVLFEKNQHQPQTIAYSPPTSPSKLKTDFWAIRRWINRFIDREIDR